MSYAFYSLINYIHHVIIDEFEIMEEIIKLLDYKLFEMINNHQLYEGVFGWLEWNECGNGNSFHYHVWLT